MIAVLYGNEPYIIDARKKKLLSGITDITVCEGEFTSETAEICSAFSFLDGKKGVVLKADTLKSLDNKTFSSYADNENPDTVLLVICRQADARTKIYKHLKGKGLLTACNKVETEDLFQKVILAELKKQGAQIKKSAMDEFMRRINYFDLDDMNLLRAVQYAEVCAAVTKEITVETVRDYVPSFEAADVFRLSSLIEKGDAEKLLRELNRLPDTDAIKVMSLILRELRIAYKLQFFREGEIGIRADRAVFKNHPPQVLARALSAMTEAVEKIKQGLFTDRIAMRWSFAEAMHILADGGAS